MRKIAINRVVGAQPFLFGGALLFVLLVHGALPFFTAPTLGQAVWTTGFSQSFLNESVFNIYARNFGAPEPAAIAFGLVGAWTASILMGFGLHPVDAYSFMIALWMSVAFLSAYKIGRYFSVNPYLSVLAAVCWMTMPVIWGHAGYSMVSSGIGLLSFYFFAALRLFLSCWESAAQVKEAAKCAFLYLGVCLVAVFMDGYSFMMFAVGSSLFGFWVLVSGIVNRRYLVCFSFPVHFVGLGVAYFLYALYIGKSQFEAAPIDFFRGWGVDILFFLIPSQGVHWLPDILGWSSRRSEGVYFGDASVWMTSFSIPVIVGAAWATFYGAHRKNVRVGLVIVALFGLYMSLGPSLKVNSVKPVGEKTGVMMEKKYAIAPTGSAFLSENVPGFKSMRASYRWVGLGVFGAWAVLILAMSAGNRKSIVGATAIVVGAVTILNLPNIPKKLESDINNRRMFLNLDAELIRDMREVVSSGERIAFLPWRNDFLVNYVASRLNAVAFNIGGDKNLAEARLNWPDTLRRFPMAVADENFANRILLFLSENEVDTIILPYIDMLWAAHRWPYPIEFKDQLAQAMTQLTSSGFVEVEDRYFYGVVRLKPEFVSAAAEGALEILVKKSMCMPPDCLKKIVFYGSTPSKVGVLADGRLLTTGKTGFLHFGPYVALAAGHYALVVRGSGKAGESAWVDVASSKGSVKHGKFSLTPKVPSDGVLAEGHVELEKGVKDVEIRVYVGAEDEISLEGYELVPIKGPDRSQSAG